MSPTTTANKKEGVFLLALFSRSLQQQREKKREKREQRPRGDKSITRFDVRPFHGKASEERGRRNLFSQRKINVGTNKLHFTELTTFQKIKKLNLSTSYFNCNDKKEARGSTIEQNSISGASFFCFFQSRNLS